MTIHKERVDEKVLGEYAISAGLKGLTNVYVMGNTQFVSKPNLDLILLRIDNR